MKLPFVKFSNCLRWLLAVNLIGVALLLVEADCVDSSGMNLVLHTFGLLITVISIYLAIEFAGIPCGYVEDDIGAPSDSDRGLRTVATRFRSMLRIH
jgi:hypothetical protein